MALITSTITYYRSTSYSFQATVKPPTPDLSVAKGLFTVKETPFDSSPPDSTALIQKTVTAINNVCDFSILPEDISDNIEPSKMYYSIHVIMNDGKIYPFASGRFNLKATTTNRES